MDIKIIYEDNDVLVADKPAGLVVFPEGQTKENTLIDELIKKYPELKAAGDQPRHGVAHRLDKDTSGILLVAKSNESLIFLQKQFKNPVRNLDRRRAISNGVNRGTLEKNVEKRYIVLVEGNIKNDGKLHTFLARSSKDFRKQTVYQKDAPNAPKSAREAITEYKVLEQYKGYTLLEIKIKTGRRHQIRCHLAFLQHPIAGDKLYKFRNSKQPGGLTRQFLHASYLKIKLPSGETKEFKSDLPEELKQVIENLKIKV